MSNHNDKTVAIGLATIKDYAARFKLGAPDDVRLAEAPFHAVGCFWNNGRRCAIKVANEDDAQEIKRLAEDELQWMKDHHE